MNREDNSKENICLDTITEVRDKLLEIWYKDLERKVMEKYGSNSLSIRDISLNDIRIAQGEHGIKRHVGYDDMEKPIFASIPWFTCNCSDVIDIERTKEVIEKYQKEYPGDIINPGFMIKRRPKSGEHKFDCPLNLLAREE